MEVVHEYEHDAYLTPVSFRYIFLHISPSTLQIWATDNSEDYVRILRLSEVSRLVIPRA